MNSPIKRTTLPFPKDICFRIFSSCEKRDLQNFSLACKDNKSLVSNFLTNVAAPQNRKWILNDVPEILTRIIERKVDHFVGIPKILEPLYTSKDEQTKGWYVVFKFKEDVYHSSWRNYAKLLVKLLTINPSLEMVLADPGSHDKEWCTEDCVLQDFLYHSDNDDIQELQNDEPMTFRCDYQVDEKYELDEEAISEINIKNYEEIDDGSGNITFGDTDIVEEVSPFDKSVLYSKIKDLKKEKYFYKGPTINQFIKFLDNVQMENRKFSFQSNGIAVENNYPPLRKLLNTHNKKEYHEAKREFEVLKTLNRRKLDRVISNHQIYLAKSFRMARRNRARKLEKARN